MVKSVLFDLDRTLPDRDTSIQQFITAQYDRLIVRSQRRGNDYQTNCDEWESQTESECKWSVWSLRPKTSGVLPYRVSSYIKVVETKLQSGLLGKI